MTETNMTSCSHFVFVEGPESTQPLQQQQQQRQQLAPLASLILFEMPIVISLPLHAGPGPGTEWEGWGTSLCWFAHALGQLEPLSSNIADLLFSPAGLGLNIVRFNLGGAEPGPAVAAAYRPGAAVPCCCTPDGAFHWSADAGQLAMLLAATRRGVDTVEAFVNSPPWFMTKSGTTRGHKRPLKSNLAKDKVQAFAAFLAEVAAHFEVAHGVRLDSVSPFNEPGSPAWCLAANNAQEGCYFSRSRAHQVLRALIAQPAIKNVALVAPEQFCVRETLSDLQHLPPDLWPALTRINAHTYTSKLFFPRNPAVKLLAKWQDNRLWRRQLRELAGRHGKLLWVSEFGSGRGPVALVKQVLKDLATLSPSAWIYWQAVEDVGTNWGLLEVALQAAGPQAADGDGAAAGTTASAIMLEPSYFALQFLAKSLPKGCRHWPCKALGHRGVCAQLSPQHRVVLFVNSHKSKARQLVVCLPLADLSMPASGGQQHCKVNVTAAALDLAALQRCAVQPSVGGTALLVEDLLAAAAGRQLQVNSSSVAAGVTGGSALLQQVQVLVEPLHVVRIDVIVSRDADL